MQCNTSNIAIKVPDRVYAKKYGVNTKAVTSFVPTWCLVGSDQLYLSEMCQGG